MTDFSKFLVKPNASVGDRFIENCSRKYRDERGEQTETFTLLIEVTKVDDIRLAYTVLGISNIVNPYKNFSRTTGGEIMGFAFNRDVGSRFQKVA